jgi:hypothetical protein
MTTRGYLTVMAGFNSALVAAMWLVTTFAPAREGEWTWFIAFLVLAAALLVGNLVFGIVAASGRPPR